MCDGCIESAAPGMLGSLSAPHQDDETIRIKMGRFCEIPLGHFGRTLVGRTNLRVRRNLWAESGCWGVQLLLLKVSGATASFDDQCTV